MKEGLRWEKRSGIFPMMSTRKEEKGHFYQLVRQLLVELWRNEKLWSDEEIQALVDRGRRILAERRLERQGKVKYVLDSRLIDGVRWTKEMKPCGNPKCKKCRERHEYHGPVYKSYVWDGERMRARSHGKNKPEGWDLQEIQPSIAEDRPAAGGAGKSRILGIFWEKVGRVTEHVLTLVGDSPIAEPERLMTPISWEHLARLRLAQREWERVGKWAEYYVSGKASEDVDKFVPEGAPVKRDPDALFPDEVHRVLDSFASEDSYLYRPVPGQDPEELTIARVKLNSDDPKELWEAAQLALLRARNGVAQFETHLWSYQALPADYYTNPTAASRLKKLREALVRGRQWTVELSEEWLDIHEKALDRLEAETDKYNDPAAASQLKKLRETLARSRQRVVELSQESLDLHGEAFNRLDAETSKEEGR